jgi:16S rRNA (uracil1498-N3)-methyltransferase
VFVGDLGAPEATDADAHHLKRVLRISHGEQVCVSDGAGGWRMCELDAGGALRPVGDSQRVARPQPTLTVGFAAPKGERTEWAVRKLTEVGVDRIVVLRTERSVVRWDAGRAERQLSKMQRWVRESARQCRRLWLPEVAIGAMADLADSLLAGSVLADAGGRRVDSSDHTILVGPEGGWTNEEREGRDLVALGENVLRTETAAVVAGSSMAAIRLWSD